MDDLSEEDWDSSSARSTAFFILLLTAPALVSIGLVLMGTTQSAFPLAVFVGLDLLLMYELRRDTSIIFTIASYPGAAYHHYKNKKKPEQVT